MHGFGIEFELSNDTVGMHWVVFRNLSFNTGRIKDSHICFGGIYFLVDRFRKKNNV